ncbi:MAG: serine hydrolase, partial [Elusimicrobiales bacterium]|nr:serine hydrolase [Elusimicrobiales bacterium]
METFSDKIAKLLDGSRKYATEIGIAIRQLPCNITAGDVPFEYYLNENFQMATASTMKLFVLGALLEKSDRKEIRLDDFYILKKEDITP